MRFKYEYTGNIDMKSIVSEIEFGNTFALYKRKEETINLKYEKNYWVELCNFSSNSFELEVKSDFFNKYNFLELLLCSFLFNLMDFGNIKLVDIDVSKLFFFPINKSNFSILNEYVILGTIFKPYFHLSLDEKIKLAHKFISLGGKLIKEDETYLVKPDTILEESQAIQGKIQDDGFYIPNITSNINDFKFIEKLLQIGVRIVMVNFLITGLRNIYELKKKFPELKIWGHRIGYSLIKHTTNMLTLSKIAYIAGIDYLHIGTPVTKNDIIKKIELVQSISQISNNFLPIFTKVTPEIIPILIRNFGNKIILMTCGYIRKQNHKEINWEKVKEIIKISREGN